MNAPTRILILASESSMRSALGSLLQQREMQIVHADTNEGAIETLKKQTIDLIICDVAPGEVRFPILSTVHRSHPDIEVIAIGTPSDHDVPSGDELPVRLEYLTPPFTSVQLLNTIGRAGDRRRLLNELATLREHVAMNYGFDNIVGISKAIAQVKQTAARIAPTDITVLINGPSGSGKELIARAIHHHSNRRKGRFIAVDCSALPEAIVEATLFGPTSDSNSSLIHPKQGMFESADSGTIFLNEVGLLPMLTQSRLVRFFQDSEVTTDSGKSTRKVNVRMIAASSQPLAALVGSGKFREDLLQRLDVITIPLPALCERMEDIEMLTEYFLRRIAYELGRPGLSITRPAVDKLLGHRWPGNVRELENTLKRGSALCAGSQLDAADISFVSGESIPADAAAETAEGTHQLVLKGGLLDTNQRAVIVKALDDNRWNYTRTAAALGIGRTTLWRKIKKYQLVSADAEQNQD
jgi:two-component system, NtrC family, response regulator AtoC